MSNRQCRVYILCLVFNPTAFRYPTTHIWFRCFFLLSQFVIISFEKLSLLFWIFYCFFFLQFILVGRHHGIFIPMEKNKTKPFRYILFLSLSSVWKGLVDCYCVFHECFRSGISNRFILFVICGLHLLSQVNYEPLHLNHNYSLRNQFEIVMITC